MPTGARRAPVRRCGGRSQGVQGRFAGLFMLILSRKVNESIVIGDTITIKILRINRDAVKLGIQAPSECRVQRQELLQVELGSNAPGRSHDAPASDAA